MFNKLRDLVLLIATVYGDNLVDQQFANMGTDALESGITALIPGFGVFAGINLVLSEIMDGIGFINIDL